MNQWLLCLLIEIVTVAAILQSFGLMLLVAPLKINTSVRILCVLIAFRAATRLGARFLILIPGNISLLLINFLLLERS